MVDTDASNHGLGAVLSQVQEGQERVIEYYSRTLTKSERNYCATRKELLAVVQAVKHFHPYLYGQEFKVRSDHASLQWLLNFRHPEGQLARWIEVLQTYNFTIEHRPGEKHGNADALSRRPCPSSCNYCMQQESKETDDNQNEPVKICRCSCAAERCQWKPGVLQTRIEKEERQKEKDKRIEKSPIDKERRIDEDISWTANEMLLSQQQDPDIGPISKCIGNSTSQPPWRDIAEQSPATKAYWAQWNSLRMKDGILHRLWLSPTGGHVMELIVPKVYQEEVIRQLHDAPTSGHFAANKTLCRVRQRFYWVGCGRDVKVYCSRCILCASRKGPGRKQRGLLQQYNVALRWNGWRSMYWNHYQNHAMVINTF